MVSAVAQGANPQRQLAMLAGAVGAYVLGRLWGHRHVPRVAMTLMVAILVVTILSGPAAFSGGPLSPTLGPANDNAALYALGAAGAVIVAMFGSDIRCGLA